MPAITVENILVLPRVPEPDVTRAERKVTSVTTAPSAYEGEGFPVRRAFAGVDLARLDPFIHMDQMGEVDYGPGEPKGTPWHPHRGFETVTYIIDGTFRHQDSNGGGGLITNGDTQWMTAGGGILHIEEPPEDLVMSGGLFHGFQLWVNLTAGRCSGSSPARSTATTARASPTPRSRWCTPPSRPAPRSGCRGRLTSTRSATCWRARARSGRSGGRSGPASSARSASARPSRSPVTPGAADR